VSAVAQHLDIDTRVGEEQLLDFNRPDQLSKHNDNETKPLTKKPASTNGQAYGIIGLLLN
jgi:hypothetical protein